MLVRWNDLGYTGRTGKEDKSKPRFALEHMELGATHISYCLDLAGLKKAAKRIRRLGI